MGRVLSGETPIVASSIKLRKDEHSLSTGRQTTLEDIYSIFLMIEQLRTTGILQEDSDGLCSEKLIAAFVRGLHDLCRPKGVMVPVSELDGLGAFMQAYRQIRNYHYAQIFPQGSTPGQYFDLLTRLQEIGGIAPLVFIPGAGTELYRGVGAIVLFGLMFATLVTIVFLPPLLVLLLEISERIRGRAPHRAQPEPAE